MRTIARSTIATLLDRLPRLGADCSIREFDVDLFRLVDARTVRKAMRTKSDLMEREEQLRRNPDIFVFEDMPFEDWASETSTMEVDCEDENGRIEFVVGSYGYTSDDGSFVEHPRLDPIPNYTTTIEDAIQFKSSIFLSHLHMTITEVDGEWGTDYRVALFSPAGEAVHKYQSDTLPHAIIGAVLGAMSDGWTYPLASYKLVD
ncbi:hypothetical protein NKK48_29140 [Mesorhizobium sp. C386A]|uniref:hypothetical protein n=1 Tax=unclassified Mesorhizobium TaxID=325217 RepID=UPI0012EC1443|nr:MULTISPECIES: hypothetical protein [unclassified Mesorhizobium]